VAHARDAWVVSVCTGALVLGAAGLLRGRSATTHWLALGEHDPQPPFQTGSPARSPESLVRSLRAHSRFA
jgi:putative intracellular protease/amidase